MSNNDLRSQSLNLLRFPLAVIILSIHVFWTGGITFQNVTLEFNEYPFFMFVNRFIDGFLRGQSVPIYYFISGYVFFLGVQMSKETYIRKFKNRVKTLLIPYLIWNTLAILMLIITLLSAFNQFKGHAAQFTPTIEGFLSAFWMYHGELEGVYFEESFPINAPLWFVRNLIIVVIFTPLIHRIIKSFKHYFIILLGFMWFIVATFEIKTYMFAEAFFFFSWGAYMSINKIDMLAQFERFFKLSVIFYITLGVLHIASAYYCPELKIFIKSISKLVGLIFAYNLSAWLLKNNYAKVNTFLASASFFIYVSHHLIAGKVLKLLYIAVGPSSSFSLLLVYITAVLVVLGGLLLTFHLLRKYAPRVLMVVAGRK